MKTLRSQDEVEARVRGNLIDILVHRKVGRVLHRGDIDKVMDTSVLVAQDAASRVAHVFRQALPEAIEVRTCETSEGRWVPTLMAAQGNFFGGNPILVRSMWTVQIRYDWKVVGRDHPARVALNALTQQDRANMLIRALTNNDRTTVVFGSGVYAPRFRGTQKWTLWESQLVDLGGGVR